MYAPIFDSRIKLTESGHLLTGLIFVLLFTVFPLFFLTEVVFISLMYIFVVFTLGITLSSSFINISPKWPLIGFCSVISYTVLNQLIGIAPVAPDTDLYHSLAVETVNIWTSGQSSQDINYYNFRVRSYSMFVGILYLIFAEAKIVGEFVNAGLWGLSVAFWVGAYRNIYNKESFYFGILLVTYPSVIRFTSRLLRESLTLLFISIAFYYVSKFSKEPNKLYPIVIISSLSGVFMLRPEVCIIFIISWGIYETYSRIINKREKQGLLILGFITIVLTGITSITRGAYSSFFEVHTLDLVRESRTYGPYSYLEYMSYSNWVDIFIYLPTRVFYFMYAPFPWELSSYHTFQPTIDAIYWIILTFPLLIGIAIYVSKREPHIKIFIVVFFLLALIGHSIVVGNFASASRRKLILFPFALFITSHALERCFGQIVIKIG